MRLLSLIALGAASVSASPDAVDEILRKLSANSSNATATSSAGSGSAAASNATATANAGGGSGNTTATASASASASASAQSQQASNTTVTTVAPVVTTVAANVTTVAASVNVTTTTTVTTVAAGTTTVETTTATPVATNGTTSNSTANSTATVVPERSIESSSKVTITVPAEISGNTTLMAAFEDMLGNSFGDLVCDKISGTGMPFAKKADCMCGTTRVNGYTFAGTEAKPTHQCKATKQNGRRAEATRRLSTGTAFTTESKVKTKVTDAQKTSIATKLTITAAAMKTDMANALKVRVAAAPASLQVIKDKAGNLTISSMDAMTSETTEVATTTAATAGAVAAASTGLGLLIAALLF